MQQTIAERKALKSFRVGVDAKYNTKRQPQQTVARPSFNWFFLNKANNKDI